MNKLTTDKLKTMLREAGVKTKKTMVNGNYVVSTALTPILAKKLEVARNTMGIPKCLVVARAIQTFKPVKVDVAMFMDVTEVKSTAGFFGKSKVDKVFGSRANIKFAGYTLEPAVYNKLNDLTEYYGISRAAVMRMVLEEFLK